MTVSPGSVEVLILAKVGDGQPVEVCKVAIPLVYRRRCAMSCQCGGEGLL